MKKFIALLGGLLFCASGALAATATLDPIVVTATRTATPLSQIASSVTVITAEEIEEKQQTQVLDVLRSVPGVNVFNNGNRGSSTTIALRGTDNKHTLVLIDGIEFRDAATLGGGPQLENLTTDAIEQIEIVRGAQSVLYGSDAIGGIINIITKKGTRTPQIHTAVEAGSFSTRHENFGFTTADDLANLAFSATLFDTDGFSAAGEKYGNTEDDGYDHTSLSLNFGLTPSETFDLNVNLRTTKSNYEYDDGYDFLTGLTADSNATQDSEDQFGRVEGTFHLLEDRLKLVVGASVTDTSRTVSGDYPAGYDGRVSKYDLLSILKLNPQHTLSVGMETEEEDADIATSSSVTSGDSRTNAIYVQDQFTAGHFTATAGARYDDHNEFGGKATWRMAPSYTLSATGTRLKGSIGTGFRAPSINELYGTPVTYDYSASPWFPAIYRYLNGNLNLKPEESFNWDIGVEQAFANNQFILGLTYFYNDIDNFIKNEQIAEEVNTGVTTYTYQTVNVASLKTSGIEATLEWYPIDAVTLKLNYTYTDSKKDDGSRKDRLPLHHGGFSVDIYPVKKLQINLNANLTGERYDGDYTGKTLPSYTLVNLAASYQVKDNLKLFGRIDNLFDKDYEEVAGYGTADFSGYVGLKLTF